MKKIIAILMVLALFSTSVFAAPLSVSASLDSPVPVDDKSEAIKGFSFEDDLFTGVQAVALTDEEAAAVEGEGPWGAFFGAIGGAIIGIVDWAVNGNGNWQTVIEPAAAGAGIGLLFPW